MTPGPSLQLVPQGKLERVGAMPRPRPPRGDKAGLGQGDSVCLTSSSAQVCLNLIRFLVFAYAEQGRGDVSDMVARCMVLSPEHAENHVPKPFQRKPAL